MSNMLIKTCLRFNCINSINKSCPSRQCFVLRHVRSYHFNKSRLSSSVVVNNHLPGHKISLISPLTTTGLRFASTKPVIIAGGHEVPNSFVIGQSLSTEDISASIPSRPQDIDLSHFIVNSDHQDVASLDPVGPGFNPLVDLSRQSFDYIPTAGQIELNAYLPTGWVYEYLCNLHSFVPWWASIAIMTLTFRAAILPVFIKQQRSVEEASELFEKVSKTQEKLQKATQKEDKKEVDKAYQDMMDIMPQVMAHQMKSLRTMLISAPFFWSSFLTLKNMTFYKIPSLTTGGILWFTDLTIADPYLILPILTAASLHLVIRISSEFGGGLDQQPKAMKLILLYVVPGVGFIFMMNFATALNCYWFTNNLISLLQAYLFTRPQIRTFLKLPPKRVVDVSKVSTFKTQPSLMETITKLNKELKQKAEAEIKLKYGQQQQQLKVKDGRNRIKSPIEKFVHEKDDQKKH